MGPFRAYYRLTNPGMLRQILILLMVLLLAGCGANFKPSPVVHVSRDAQHGYEIQLDYSYRSFGGPCNFPQKPQTINSSDWIFTQAINGEILADHLTLWHGNSPKDKYGWPVQALRGFVTFTNSELHVALEVPVYRDDDSIAHHDHYKLNGNYKVEVK